VKHVAYISDEAWRQARFEGFLKGECWQCLGQTRLSHIDEAGEWHVYTCHRCNGTGREPGHAIQLSLYRYFDEDHRLLYIGQTRRKWQRRVAEHGRDADWFDLVASWTRDCSFTSPGQLTHAETQAILLESPRFNQNQGNCRCSTCIDLIKDLGRVAGEI
jgi:hypothetical protein